MNCPSRLMRVRHAEKWLKVWNRKVIVVIVVGSRFGGRGQRRFPRCTRFNVVNDMFHLDLCEREEQVWFSEFGV